MDNLNEKEQMKAQGGSYNNTSEVCPNCGYEPCYPTFDDPTVYYECSKCGHKWI